MAKSKKKPNKKPPKKSTMSSNQSSKWIFWVIGIFSVCVLGLIFLGNFSGKEKEQEQEAAINYENQPYLGEESAPVQIVEFGDYKCPVCKDFNESFFPQIEKELIETGKVKFYFMNDPFINVDSERSALFAEAVYQELGNDAFWKFHERLYEKQPEDVKYEKVDLYTPSFLESTLKEIASEGEVSKVVKAFEENNAKNALDQDLSYVEKLGVTGTPTLFINGKQFEGRTFDDFKEMVKKAAKEKSGDE
ncbi:DsbA family protein [Bacillus songklensis]|uniref:DsbA family protein n=1 Tax=Bacillus songklensis TaxID=1069116 RepID=A0ABV8B2Z9_9BACI